MVFYFTATGNSLYVAKQLDPHPVSIPQVAQAHKKYSAERIGIVCPVYCGELPQLVKDFLKNNVFETAYLYLVLTYGASASDCPSFTAAACKEFGLQLDYIGTVQDVDNYLPAFDMAEELKLDKQTQAQIDRVVQAVEAKEKGIPTATPADVRLHRQVAMLNKLLPALNNGKQIQITKSCAGCVVCAGVCPIGNLVVENGHARRKSRKCQFCLACVHACPQKAIVLRHEKNKSCRYRNRHISLEEIMAANAQGGSRS